MELKENSSRQVMITVLKMADCVPQGFHAGFVSKRIVVLYKLQKEPHHPENLQKKSIFKRSFACWA